MIKKYFNIRNGILSMLTFFANFIVIKSQTTATQTFNFTNNGAVQTFTVPFGVTSITIEAWGAGGGGGGANTNATRGGGGGGAYSRNTLTTTSGTVYSLVVGQGGIGTSNPGGAGGSTSFYLGATTYALAAGGSGGNSTTGGAGGLASASLPATGGARFSGGNGGNGSTNGGGGGGSAGSTGNGGTGSAGTATSGGAGGVAGAGTPAGAPGGTGGTRSGSILNYTAGAGTAGIVPGAGGGGRSSGTFNSTTSGGAGAGGRVVVSYIINYIDLSVTKSISNSTPLAGDVITFTINARNNNPTNAASSVLVTDLLPSGYRFISASQAAYTSSTGVWNVGNLSANTTVSLIITAMVNDTGTYNNTATVNSVAMPDDVTANNTATINVSVCKGGSTAPQLKL